MGEKSCIASDFFVLVLDGCSNCCGRETHYGRSDLPQRGINNSVFALRFISLAVPVVDLSIGAKLLTSSKLVIGKLVGDPRVDVARSENASCIGRGL